MGIATKGVYRQGRVDFERKPDLREGTKVVIIPMDRYGTQIGFADILMQQRAIEKFWGDEEEDLYGEV